MSTLLSLEQLANRLRIDHNLSSPISRPALDELPRDSLVDITFQLLAALEEHTSPTLYEIFAPRKPAQVASLANSSSTNPLGCICPPSSENPLGVRVSTPVTAFMRSAADSVLSEDRDGAVAQYTAAKSVDHAGFDVVNEYTLLDPIGSGSSGKVYLALHNSTNEARAIKVIPQGRVAATFAKQGVLAMKEVAIMKKLRHKHIVRLYECIDDPDEQSVYLVMQYADKGPVARVSEIDGTCTPLSLSVVARYAKHVVSALRYLHARGITHRDIKPENIVCDSDDNAYVADFGVSSLVGSGTQHSFGTPLYIAPEVLNGEEAGPVSDIWALGVTLYALIYGRLPFFATTYRGVIDQVLHAPLTFPPSSADKVKWQVLLRQLLERDPAKRISLKTLAHHPLVDGRGSPDGSTRSDGSAIQISDDEGPLCGINLTQEELLNSIVVKPSFRLWQPSTNHRSSGMGASASRTSGYSVSGMSD